jgi:hypothetical protein
VAINSLSIIYVQSDTIALQVLQIRFHAMAQMSIKISKEIHHASLLVLRGISVQIVKGQNVSLRKVNCHSTVMVLRKVLKNVMSVLIIL